MMKDDNKMLLNYFSRVQSFRIFKRNMQFRTVRGQGETTVAYFWSKNRLKVPKCEIFHLFDLNDFCVIKSI
jgi:hypothetical protein